MNSLFFLVLTSMKNSFKELLRKPGKLILYILVFGSIIGLVFISDFTKQQSGGNVPMFWLQGIYFLFVLLFTIISVQKGLTSGDSIFEMSDVNFLFVSPVNPRKILIYGLVRLAKMSFLSGIFILFQSNNLAYFGISFSGLLILFFVFILSMIVHSILSLAIYSATNGNPARKRVVKALTVLMFVPFAVYFVLQISKLGMSALAIETALSSLFFKVIPFAGWTTSSAICFLQGNLLAGFGWLALLIVSGIALTTYILLSRVDYYEDVLVATETAFEKKRAMQEGDIQAMSATSKKVKVSKTGVGGAGASAIFYKHLRETFRKKRFGFFDLYTILIFAIAVACAIFLKDGINITIILQILMWIQIFLVGNGSGLKELYTHYIYMIPVSSFKKIVWSNLETVLKTLIESVLFLGVPGIIVKENFLVILLSIVTYTLFSLFLLSINYFSMRWTDANISQGILLLIYFAAVIILMLPGLIPALILGFSIGGIWGTALALLIISIWEFAASMVIFALSKGALHNSDMPSIKKG